MSNTFFAWMSRLRLIRRWGLMHPVQPENDAEHSLQTAVIAHGIAVIARDRYQADVVPEQVVTLAVYHDASEVFTGDMPTPVKYRDPALLAAFHQMEENACRRLSASLPAVMRPAFDPYLFPDGDSRAWKIVKAADKISAWAHCQEELRLGNREFAQAADKLFAAVRAVDLPEVRDFMRDFESSFRMTLDEMGGVQE